MRLLLLLLGIVSIQICSAQQTEHFEPYGKPTLRMFGNVHTGLSEADDLKIFEIDRAFLGYQYFMSPNLMAEIKVDIGSPDDESVYALAKRYAYFRNAYIKYSQNGFSLSFGIVGMNHFKVQEGFWGYRYLEKSFADRFRFARSVDMGVNASYKINDVFLVDAAVVNGESHSQLLDINYFDYHVGATVTNIGNFTGRVSANYEPSDNKPKMVYAFFAGYRINEKLSIGADFNLLYNNRFFENRNQSGYSLYSTWAFNEHWKLFGRFDMLESNIPEGGTSPWNLSTDGSQIVAGFEHKVNDNLKLALNYRDWVPKAANMNNRHYIYLNVEFKL